MLPNFEVVVPEKEVVDVARRARDRRKEGRLVFQAGSYKKFEDADRVRAQLALQGIESNVQRVAIDSDTWHRVRIGPISDPAELNRVRKRLKRSGSRFSRREGRRLTEERGQSPFPEGPRKKANVLFPRPVVENRTSLPLR